MRNYLKAQQNEKVHAKIMAGVDESVQKAIADTMDAFSDVGRPQNPPFGTGLIWNPAEQSLLVKIGIARKRGMSFSGIASMLSREGLTDRRGKAFTASQVRRYLAGVPSEDTLQKVVLEKD